MCPHRAMDKHDQFQVPCNFFSMVLVQWIPELRHYAPSVPIILVGTKLGMSHFQFSPWNMGSLLWNLMQWVVQVIKTSLPKKCISIEKIAASF